MTAATAIGMNRTGSLAATRPAAGGGLSAINLLAAGVHGFLPPPGRSAVPAAPQSIPAGGVGRIEGKLAALIGRLQVAFGKTESIATLWITVPFAALFALGCLTLA